MTVDVLPGIVAAILAAAFLGVLVMDLLKAADRGDGRRRTALRALAWMALLALLVGLNVLLNRRFPGVPVLFRIGF